MSLYLGKDSAGKNALILTKNTISQTSIKNSTASASNNFAIDTRRDLLFCDTYTVINPVYIRTYTRTNYKYYVYRIYVPSEFISVNGHARVSLYFLNNYEYRVNYALVSATDMSAFGANSYYQGTNFIDIHTLFNALSDIVLVSLRTTTNGLTVPYDSITNRAIKVSSSEFILNGNNYFNRTFLVTPPINNIDPFFLFGGKPIQIVNGSNSGNINLSINNTSVTANSGSKKILDSNANYLQLFMIDQVVTGTNFTVPGGYAPTILNIMTIPSAYKVLSITYYPRYSIYPHMKVHGILVNDGSKSPIYETIYQDTFPCNDDGNIVDGSIDILFYIENNIVKVEKSVEYSGNPEGSYPAMLMRFEYTVVAE